MILRNWESHGGIHNTTRAADGINMRTRLWTLLGALAISLAVLWGIATTNQPDYSMPPAPLSLDPSFDGIVAEGSEITLHYMGANRSCRRLVDLLAEETTTEVRLTLVEERHSKDQFCTAEGIFLTATVELGRPLGDRSVIDATSNQTIGALSPDDWRRNS